VLLDDPFSALDQITSNELMNFLKFISIKENKLIILVTHSVNLLKDVNCIILFKGGQEENRGNYNEMMKKSSIFNNMVQQTLRSENNYEIMNVDKKDDNLNIKDKESIKSNDIELEESNFNDSLENMEVGKINMNIYISYFRSIGYFLIFVIILTTMLMQATSNLMAYWYALWSSSGDSYSITEFIIISSVIVGSNIFCAFLRSFSFAYGGLKACKLLYNNLISSLLDVNLSFYEENSIGIIINRIGKDTYCLDDQLPFMLNIVLAQVFSLLGTFVIISYTDPIVIIILIFVIFSYYKLQNFYRKSSRELRRLDSIYKSPVYSLISECISNSPTLRSLCCKSMFNIPYIFYLVQISNISYIIF
jgi:ATP-binding cassette subfamily C (CFTR/MRP) protein 10